MTSGQEKERGYSDNPRARTGMASQMVTGIDINDVINGINNGNGQFLK